MATIDTNHILVGLGGTGGKILRAFKMRMFEEFPNKAEREKLPVALLYVDSTREMMGIGRQDMDVMGQDASFGENEFLFIKGCDVPDLLDNVGAHPELKGIVDNVSAVRTAIGNLGEAAGQMRRAGRLLFAVNAAKYVAALKNCFAKCNERSHNNSKQIHIFAGLSGGTGSGSIIDAIVQTRNIPGWSDAKINVYAMIPEQDLPKPDMDKGRYYENGYAALRELNALQSARFKPCDVLSNGAPLNVFSERIKGVANGITVYSNVNANGQLVDSFEELPKLVSDYVYSFVFLISPKKKECEDVIRAFNFENMDSFAFEHDECELPKEGVLTQEMPIVRTKKLNSFGVKRVIYPELRVLKHMTYTVGKSVLYQFRYNNWRSNLGFIDEEVNFDYRAEYLKPETLNRWMLDEAHLTLEEEVITTKDGAAFDLFSKDWKGRVNDFVDFCSSYENPLSELSRQMNAMYEDDFREGGVLNYYKTKLRSLPQIALKIRDKIEKELFGKWRDGQISIVELNRIGELLASYVADDLKKNLDASLNDNKEKLKESDDVLSDITKEWADVGFFGKYVTKKKTDLYAKYADELVYNMELGTRIVGLEFARNLSSELQRAIGGMSDDISKFSKLLSDCIDETNRLITAQQKINKGLEDMSGSVIEVSEESRMEQYEKDICINKDGMQNICRQLREEILPDTEFKNFGDLLTRISERTIKHAFDVRLSEIIKAKHADLPNTATKVLGLNILTQLQQKLGRNHQKLQEFAHQILEQSGAYIDLDGNEIIANVRNNEPPVENLNINSCEMLISIPSPNDNPDLQEFANDLKQAFESQVELGVKKPRIFMESTRKNELSIITIRYCFPMRAISWLKDYRRRYERYLHTGNASMDLNHNILVHSEAMGDNLPGIFAKTQAELEKIDAERENDGKQVGGGGDTTGITPPPPPRTEPQVQMYLNVGGQNYGPYDYVTLKGFVPTGQLTAQTLVWQQGMAAWQPAGQVPELQALFAPVPPAPGTPPMPPTSGAVPPPMM